MGKLFSCWKRNRNLTGRGVTESFRFVIHSTHYQKSGEKFQFLFRHYLLTLFRVVRGVRRNFETLRIIYLVLCTKIILRLNNLESCAKQAKNRMSSKVFCAFWKCSPISSAKDLKMHIPWIVLSLIVEGIDKKYVIFFHQSIFRKSHLILNLKKSKVNWKYEYGNIWAFSSL